jgi:hypothetical protein
MMPLPQSILFSHCPMGIPAITVPIGDPHSNRNPQLSSGGYLDHTFILRSLYLSPRAAFLGQVLEKERAIAVGLWVHQEGPIFSLVSWGSLISILLPTSSPALSPQKCTLTCI